MNKTTSINKNDEMLDDYGELLEQYDSSQIIRGKYAHQNQQPSIVKIINGNQEKTVILKTIKTEAIVNEKGELTINISSEFSQGKYQATLIIEQPIQEN